MKCASKDSNKGQALLLVLLSMAVVLTIVLSILARSSLDIGVSSRSEEAVRAFSAAEAGIEQALIAGSASFNGSFENASFTGTVSAFASGVYQFITPTLLHSGESSVVWFVGHDSNGNLSCDAGDCFKGRYLEVCWGQEGTASDTGFTPAMEVSVVYLDPLGSYENAMVARTAIDPNTSRASSFNSFFTLTDTSTCQVDGVNFAFRKKIDFDADLNIPPSVYNNPGGLQLARLSILYNTDMGHPVAVNADFPGRLAFPSQGVTIISEGVAGDSTRKVEVTRSFKELPGIFETAVFSSGGITK